MKRAGFLLISLLSVQLSVLADPYVVASYTDSQGISYNLLSDQTAVVTYYTCSNSEMVELTIASEIEYSSTTYYVTTIQGYAFGNQSCSCIKKITIPYGVTTIGNGAFQYCTGLTQLIIPDSVTSLGSQICEGCSSLELVVIGTGLTEMGIQDFESCTSLKLVIFKSETAPTIVGTSGTFEGGEFNYDGGVTFCYPEAGEASYKGSGWVDTVLGSGSTSNMSDSTIEDFLSGLGYDFCMPCTNLDCVDCDDTYGSSSGCVDAYYDPTLEKTVKTCDEEYNPHADPNNDEYCDTDEEENPIAPVIRYTDPETGKVVTVCDDEYNPHADPYNEEEYCNKDPDTGEEIEPVIRYTDPETGKVVTVCDDEYNPSADPYDDEYCDTDPETGKPLDPAGARYTDPETGKAVTVCDSNYNSGEDPYSDEYCDPEQYGYPIIRYEDPFTGEEITVCDDDYNPYLDPNSEAYCDQYGEPVGRYHDPMTGWTMTACDDGYDPSLDPYVDNDGDNEDDGGIKKNGEEEDDPKEEDDATEHEPDDPTEKLDDEHKTVLDTDVEEQPGVEEIIPDEVIIRAEDTSIYVSTPTLSRVTVNDLSGVMLIDEMVEGTVKLEVGSRGLFIVKVGHALEKVLLK